MKPFNEFTISMVGYGTLERVNISINNVYAHDSITNPTNSEHKYLIFNGHFFMLLTTNNQGEKIDLEDLRTQGSETLYDPSRNVYILRGLKGFQNAKLVFQQLPDKMNIGVQEFSNHN